MEEYVVEFTKKDIMSENSEPHGPYKHSSKGNSLEEAASNVIPELLRIGFLSGYSDIWDATITNSEGERYEILKDGGWLVDLKTGKRLESKVVGSK